MSVFGTFIIFGHQLFMGRSRRSSSLEEVEMEPSATSPLRQPRYGYSHESIGRFSEHSLHYPYRIQDTKTCGKLLKTQ